MDPLTRKILGWMAGVDGSVITIVCLLLFAPVRTGGMVCGLITAGLAAFCYWWPKKYLRRPEVGITWSVSIVGGLATLLYSFLHPIAATALFVNVAMVAGAIGFFSVHALKEGRMYPILLLTWWRHTRINRLDTEVAAQFPSAARHGHFGFDVVFAVWPWRVYKQSRHEYGWPTHLITVDVGEVLVKTKAPGEVYLMANPAIAFRWGPDLRRALNILDASRVQVDEGGDSKSVDPANDDGTLTAYFEPWVLGAIRNVVARQFTFGVDPATDINANVDALRDAMLEHLAQPEGPFAQLGLLELVEYPQPGEKRWKLGVSGRTFELEIPQLFPQEGTDLAKAIGAQVVAARLAEQRAIQADAEANFETKVGMAKAGVEATRTERVGVAAATAARARIDAETGGIEEQMKRLSKKKGLTPVAVLDAMTTRSAAQAGGTMVMFPGLAGAATAVAEVMTSQKGGGGVGK